MVSFKKERKKCGINAARMRGRIRPEMISFKGQKVVKVNIVLILLNSAHLHGFFFFFLGARVS